MVEDIKDEEVQPQHIPICVSSLDTTGPICFRDHYCYYTFGFLRYDGGGMTLVLSGTVYTGGQEEKSNNVILTCCNK